MEYRILNGLSPEYIESLKERFWAKVDIGEPDECWEWTAVRSWKNYGQFGVMGKSIQPAHRVSWEINRGPIGNHHICHTCDNPPCVNPNHLFLGDAFANMQDASRKGRLVSPRQKLTESAVRKLRNTFNPYIHKVDNIAESLGVSAWTISAALRGKTHKRAGGKIHDFIDGRRIDDALFPEIISRYQNGQPALHIAKELNIGKSSVYRILIGKQRRAGEQDRTAIR